MVVKNKAFKKQKWIDADVKKGTKKNYNRKRPNYKNPSGKASNCLRNKYGFVFCDDKKTTSKKKTVVKKTPVKKVAPKPKPKPKPKPAPKPAPQIPYNMSAIEYKKQLGKTIKEMTPKEKTIYQRLRTRNSRAKARARKEASKPVKKAPVKKVAPKPAPKKAPVKKAPVKKAPVKKAPVKKVEPKPAPKPVKKEEPKTEKPKDKLGILMEDIIDVMNKPSKRGFNNFLKKNPDADMLKSIFSGNRWRDFYPTPEHCFNKFKNEIKDGDNVLEPTAGLGALVYYAMKNNKVNITANEINPAMVKFLKENFKGAKITDYDFLKHDYANNNFDVILINPPFSDNKKKGFHFDFLFKSMKVLNQSKKKVKRLLFISPKLTKDEEPLNSSLLLVDNLNVGKAKYNKLQKEYGDLEDIEPNVIFKVGECKGFGGTQTTANMYVGEYF